MAVGATAVTITGRTRGLPVRLAGRLQRHGVDSTQRYRLSRGYVETFGVMLKEGRMI